MHERLFAFLTKHKYIYDLQFGFRTGAIDDNKFAVGVFIDTVDHTILLKKLYHYGIHGVANSWFKSYLSNRKQFVTINGVKTDLQSMEFGVPQGSVSYS